LRCRVRKLDLQALNHPQCRFFSRIVIGIVRDPARGPPPWREGLTTSFNGSRDRSFLIRCPRYFIVPLSQLGALRKAICDSSQQVPPLEEASHPYSLVSCACPIRPLLPAAPDSERASFFRVRRPSPADYASCPVHAVCFFPPSSW